MLPSRSGQLRARNATTAGVAALPARPRAGPARALRRRLSEPRLERFIGVIYRPETERWSHYSEAVLPEQFDACVWFDEPPRSGAVAEPRPASETTVGLDPAAPRLVDARTTEGSAMRLT